MSLDDATIGLLRQLMERIEQEREAETLHELILAMNRLLNAVEAQIVKLEGPSDPSVN
jgi:hypothetical protein